MGKFKKYINLFIQFSFGHQSRENLNKDFVPGPGQYVHKNVVGYEGKIVNDLTKPDGTPRKLLDVSKLHATGWKHKTTLEEGIAKVYKWYLTAENIRK